MRAVEQAPAAPLGQLGAQVQLLTGNFLKISLHTPSSPGALPSLVFLWQFWKTQEIFEMVITCHFACVQQATWIEV